MKTMKNILPKVLFLALALLLTTSVSAQKYAYIDSDYILKNVPEYQDAQNQMDDLSEKWQKEIEAKFVEIEELYKKYQADVVLLPADMKKKREEEIINFEKEVKQFQQDKFGQTGELFKKRHKLKCIDSRFIPYYLLASFYLIFKVKHKEVSIGKSAKT